MGGLKEDWHLKGALRLNFRDLDAVSNEPIEDDAIVECSACTCASTVFNILLQGHVSLVARSFRHHNAMLTGWLLSLL